MAEINKLAAKDIIYLKCPLLKHDCIGDKCMWWFEGRCAITILAART